MAYKIYDDARFSRNLLVLNYAMDENSQVFSHQIEVVRELALRFRKVVVITAQSGQGNLPLNVRVLSSNWKHGQDFRNLSKFIILLFKVLLSERFDVLFSHMTEVQSTLSLPFTKLFRIRHILWYAHASKSKWMGINAHFVDQIVTSTRGSCPYSGNKVIYIGQAVSPEIFPFRERHLSEELELVHVGRIDRSKKIIEIIRVVQNFRNSGYKLKLAFFGAPTNPAQDTYYREVLNEIEELNASTWVTLNGNISRSLLRYKLDDFDIFIHSFEGSLDKTLVEATMSGLPVATINREYCSEFGFWGDSLSLNLTGEMEALLACSGEEVRKETHRRYKIALENHTLKSWVSKLSSVLVPDDY